ncbi:hypothetical protein FACS1894199_07070 [Bacteroidia bacterium]|nr:hypothetical protein FACS1894199_07070 [Bacteroidia bacterium]
MHKKGGFIIFLLLVGIACNNDVTSIGQNLIDDQSNVEVIEYRINNTSTVRIDSFVTSETTTSTGTTTTTTMAAGRITDPISGTITATPFIVFEPANVPTIQDYYIYDSITLHISPAQKTWGDSLKLQKFYLHWLKELPKIDDYDYTIYNTYITPHEATPFDSIVFLPTQENFQHFYFNLNKNLGNTVYQMLKVKDENITNTINFLKWFKGIAFIPAPDNNCLMNWSSTSTDFAIQVHYHHDSQYYTYNINKASSYYYFNYVNIKHEPVMPYLSIIKQQDGLPFQTAKQVISQGLNGYLLKIQLPIHPAGEKYRTIIKAEIRLNAQYATATNNFHDLSTIAVYSSDEYNRILGSIAYNSSYSLSGRLVKDTYYPENDHYLINITDYYSNLMNNPNAGDINHLLVGIQSTLLSTSFDKMVIDELPLLRVYYAKYE